MNYRQQIRTLRHFRVRKKLSGTSERPRLSVFVSNRHFYAQIINDETHNTLCAISTLQLNLLKNNRQITAELGKKLAKLAKEKNITKVVFDRGGFLFHGKVAAFAKGARSQGLKF